MKKKVAGAVVMGSDTATISLEEALWINVENWTKIGYHGSYPDAEAYVEPLSIMQILTKHGTLKVLGRHGISPQLSNVTSAIYILENGEGFQVKVTWLEHVNEEA